MEKNGYIVDVIGCVFDWLAYKPEKIIRMNFKNQTFLLFKSILKISKKPFKWINGLHFPLYELKFTDIDGEKRKGKVSVSTKKDKQVEIKSIISNISDITRLKKIEQELLNQQNQLKTTFSVSSDMLALIDQDYKYRAVNPAFCKYMNLEEAELIGKTDFDLYKKEEAKQYIESNITVFNSGKKWENDICAVGLDGIERWFQVIKSPVIGNAGLITGILINIRDITSRKDTEIQIKRQKDFLDKMFDSSASGVILVNESKKIVKINNKALRIFGREKEELSGLIACDLFNCPFLDSECQSMKTGKELISTECQVLNKKGEKIPIIKLISKIKDGKETYFLESIVDISKHKSLEEELMCHKKTLEEIVLERTRELEETNAKLLIAKNKAEESDRLKSAFLANMSHEIRTPMNIILGFTELLNFEDSKQTKLEYTQNIQKSVNHLLELINDIIDLSKIEAGLKKANNSRVLINDKLGNTYEHFMSREKCLNGKVKLVLDNKGGDINEEMISDPRIFNQILVNLIDNALKFTDEGNVSFGYGKFEKNGAVFYEFYVKDTGIGISDSDKAIIFDRFRQVDYSDKRVYGGTGLGLSICKANLDLLGGEIWVDSKIGEGSTFYFSIPASNE